MSEVQRHTGKWSQSGVPHKGWTCDYVEDLGTPSEICGMCETQEIRYVHHMRHPNYPEEIGAGCVCAGNMEEDSEAARSREATAKSKSARRRRWLSRNWKVSAKGNPFINTHEFNIVIFPIDYGWGFRVTDNLLNKVLQSTRLYPTADKAKLGAFDVMISLEAQKQDQ